MKDKIIITDVDGTLLPASNELPLSDVLYLQSLEKDNLVVLCSGRGYHDLSCLHDKLGLKSPIISSNGGALSFFDGRENVCMSIQVSSIKNIFDKHKDIIISAFYSYENYLFIYNKLDKLQFLYKENENTIVVEGPYSSLDLKSPNSVYFILKNNLKEEFFKDINQNYSDEISYDEFGHDASISIVILNLKNTNKAYAILELLMITGKSEEDTIIFGDAEPDISMLKLNGITVAMKNGTNEAREAAKYITQYDNNNGGVIKFLQDLEKKTQ